MKAIRFIFFLVAGLIILECKTAAADPNLFEIIFSRNRDPGNSSGNERNVKVKWKHHGNDDGFGQQVGTNWVISWAITNATNVNFAIVLPSTNYWIPTNTCVWTNVALGGSWPAVLPATNGKVYLQFRPGASAKPKDAFHYKIAVFPHGYGYTTKTTTTNGEDFPYPPDSDPDIIDTTIVWSGGRPP